MSNFNIFNSVLRKDFKSFTIKVFKELNHGKEPARRPLRVKVIAKPSRRMRGPPME